MCDTARADKRADGHLLISLLHPTAAVHLSRQTADLPDTTRPFHVIVPLIPNLDTETALHKKLSRTLGKVIQINQLDTTKIY